MKQFYILSVILFGGLLVSCNKILDTERPDIMESEEIQVSLTYTLDTSVGQDMTKTTHSDIFREFYNKITSADLVASDYSITLTEVNTGVKYVFVGSWASHHLVTIRTGKYRVTGTSTATGGNLQEKCSLYFDDEVSISSSATTVVLPAKYDCFLLVFNQTGVATLQNIDGDKTEDFFDFGTSYKYAFVNSALYSETNKDTAHIFGKYTDTEYFKVFTGNLVFEKGKYYIYNSIAGGFNLPEMEDGESTYDTTTTANLSAGGTANCYIVPSAGHYYFNASVKGNSSQSVGTIASAEVLWETFNTDQTPSVGDLISNISVENGIVSFDASENTGNALIAVKDSEGTILWSWHIWRTDYNPENDYDVYAGHDNIKVMDRNLGALSSNPGIESFGLIYEWGRKDPFMGSSSLNGFTAFASTSSQDQVTSSTEYGTVEYAIQHPTTYIIATTQGGDWLQTSIDDAWSSEKSIYDPCPSGWRIPDGGPDGLWNGFDIANRTNWEFDATKGGMTFGAGFGTPDVWMPAQGYHGDSSTYSSGWWRLGVEGRYWTTYTMENKYSDFFSFSSTGSSPYSISGWSTHNSRANGIAVRCCK